MGLRARLLKSTYYFLPASSLCSTRFNIRFRKSSAAVFLVNKYLKIANQGSSRSEVTQQEADEETVSLF